MRPNIRFLDRRSPPHVFTLVMIAGLGALSLNIFLPALPAMAETFGTSYGAMQLTVSAYLAATALVQIIIGPVSDLFGRRPVLLGVIALFTLASFGAALAPSYEVFFACRLVQAVIASSFAISRAIVRDMVPPEEAASMIGYVTMGMSLVPMIGPAIGGLLQKSFGWQASLWLLALSGLALFLLVWRDLGETAARRPAGFAAQFRAYPALLRAPAFWAYCAASTFASGVFFAFLGGVPFVGAEVYHLSPTVLGLGFAAPALGYLLGNFFSGRFSTRFGLVRMVMLGAWVTTLGLALLLLIDAAFGASPWVFFGLTSAMGLGNGIMLPSANSGMLSVRPELAGSASGLGAAITIGGGAALSVLAGQLLGPGTGAAPLIWVMAATSALSVLAAYWIAAQVRRGGR